ncbi:MAG: glycosyltransferase family 9 protein [Candidatus Omnitrophota bacterium]|nr:glycosyltransferase family 9 protein [Candidatus Omnitrophota bacterium]
MLKDIKKILLITLSNIGDVVLTTPVISVLKREFPGAGLSIMVGPKAKELFESVPGINLIAYNKRISLREKAKLALGLRRQRYDLVVDLRNTVFPLLIGARYRTAFLTRNSEAGIHARDKHLYKLKFLDINTDQASFFIWVDKDDQSYIDRFINEQNIASDERLVAISPGSRSDIKRWLKEGFAEVGDKLAEEKGIRVIMTGGKNDRDLVKKIIDMMKNVPVDISGQTNLGQLAGLLKRCALHITNDSAPMHISAALDIPTLAIFGPTDWRKYGPNGDRHFTLWSNLNCSPCEVSQCRYNHECMKSITSGKVYETARKMLGLV